ncbi:MAG: B12-binding domain-containing radical SAM protein [Nitrososphaerota archaeon]|nr:B12-binding domain-containing radical SAM protein [Nitrososphaerota archaeon]
MRVCLINPPRIQPKAWGRPNVFPPIVMASIASVLEKNHQVTIIDTPTEGWNNLIELDATKYRVGLSAETIADRIKCWRPDVVIVEIPFSGWSKTAYEVVTITKNVDKNISVVLFGLHPSSRPKDCLQNSEADFVVIGEPELTLSELILALEQKKTDLSSIDGLGYKKTDTIILNRSRDVIEDLDTLPMPARHLLPMQVYADAVKENPLRGEITKPNTIVITSRGCPFNCVFCTHSILWGKKWRPRSPKNVVDELEHVIKTYGIKQIDFADDNMTWDPKRIAEICELIVERGLHFEWFTPNGVRADTLNEELLGKMKQAGCKKIRIAPESGVQRIVSEVAKKNLDLKKVEAAIIACKKIGIKVGCFFVMGLIGETKQDIEATIQYAYKLKTLGAESFIFSIAMPLYGTTFYEQAKTGGYICEGFCDYALAATEPLVETPQFTAQELTELCIKANAINRTVTTKKILKALRHPRRTAQMLLFKSNTT